LLAGVRQQVKGHKGEGDEPGERERKLCDGPDRHELRHDEVHHAMLVADHAQQRGEKQQQREQRKEKVVAPDAASVVTLSSPTSRMVFLSSGASR